MLIRHFRRFCALGLAALLLCGGARAQELPMNILLIGVDTAYEEQNGRSDTMMLVRVDPSGSLRMVSFLRDLYVSIPGVGKTRLNAAYPYGGEELLKKTLDQNFGISVDRTVTVHFSMLERLVDQLGGVELEITEQERVQLNNLLTDYNASYGMGGDRLAQAGLQRLNGRQALCYSRIRKIDSDFQRTSRQQEVIAAMIRQAGKMSRLELLMLALRNLNEVHTDLTMGDLTKLVPLAAQLDALKMETAHVPFDGTYRDETINGMMVLIPDLATNREKLHAFLDDR